MMTYSPKEIFENNKLPGEIEFDICSHQEDKVWNILLKLRMKYSILWRKEM